MDRGSSRKRKAAPKAAHRARLRKNSKSAKSSTKGSQTGRKTSGTSARKAESGPRPIDFPSKPPSKSPKKSAEKSAPVQISLNDPVARRQSDIVENCIHCKKLIDKDESLLYVESEVGRVFCSEGCISGYFAPRVESLETAYRQLIQPTELGAEEREALLELRWSTLENPDEIWMCKTEFLDNQYTLISEFELESESGGDQKTVWNVCICLFLRGEPSFLFLALITHDSNLVDQYRLGHQIEWEVHNSEPETAGVDFEPAMQIPGENSGQTSESWAEIEFRREDMLAKRKMDDIKEPDFPLYDECLGETLETPDEVWRHDPKNSENGEGLQVYHFLHFYPGAASQKAKKINQKTVGLTLESGIASLDSTRMIKEEEGHWYVVAAKETLDREQIEIIEAFPTRDLDLVAIYRRGKQEYGDADESTNGDGLRMVH